MNTFFFRLREQFYKNEMSLGYKTKNFSIIDLQQK